MKVKKILVSQPQPTDPKSPYFDMMERYGVKIDFRQLIRIERLSAIEYRKQHLNPLEFSAIIFNSRHGINHFFHLCEDLRIKVPQNMKYFCTKEQIANYLQKYIQYRKRKVFFPEDGTREGLVELMQKHTDETYMLVSSETSHDNLFDLATAAGINVKRAVMYRTIEQALKPAEVEDYDMFVLFTPMGVESLQRSANNEVKQEERIIACLGANTANSIRDLGWRLDIEVPSPEFTSITAAIDAFLKENHKRIRK